MNIYVQQNTTKTSIYAQHIINTEHTYGNKPDTMEIIQVATKSRYMNNIEKYHIFCTQKTKHSTP